MSKRKKELKMKKKTKTFVIVAIISALILGFGLSYAYFTWQSEETAVRITVDGVPISYNAGEDITGNLLPTLTKEEGISKDITVKLTKDNYESYIVYYLKINELPDELKHASFKYEMYKNNVLNKAGNFESVNVNDVIPISQSNALSNIEDTYTLYLWIDGNMENPLEMANQTFSFTLYARAENEYTDTGGVMAVPAGCEKTYGMEKVNGINQLVESIHCPVAPSSEDTSGANAPDLFEGMIPVRWDETDTVVKADVANDSENLWYNYSHRMWANAVMVTSGTRENYMNAEAGTPITTSDILAYWVWIPRYRYELFNATFESGTSAQQIEIVFESASITKSTGKVGDIFTNGEMYTHPAFTFGNTELNGFWVAKFEPSGSAIAGNLKVLPGVSSLRNMTVGAQYTASQQFANTAYLTETGVALVDVHMMKNTEWGAVAYLSHSIYGKNAEITLNANSSFYTGGGTGTAYTTNIGMSTTGNVYGVYDMSGSAWDRVVGNLNNVASGGLIPANLDSKYVDIYTGTTVASSIMGDAVGETAGWYGDSAVNFVNSSLPWFVRGCGIETPVPRIGTFCFDDDDGSNNISSFRPVLSAK